MFESIQCLILSVFFKPCGTNSAQIYKMFALRNPLLIRNDGSAIAQI